MNIFNKKIKKQDLNGEQSEIREDEILISYENMGFNLDSSKVDYKLSRELYNNTHNNYKLGGHFVKPVINALNGFIGVPKFSSNDENANLCIKEYLTDIDDKISNNTRNCLREGDSYIYVWHSLLNNKLYNNELKINIMTLLPENVNLLKNENGINKAIITNIIKEKDENNQNINYKVTDIWTIKEFERIYDFIDVPSWFEKSQNQKITNPLGFIPIIHFKNENEDYRKYGTSEIEAIEPLLRAYHETLYNYLRASKLNSSPKLILKINDKLAFLNNNFTSEERKSKKLKLVRKDMIYLENNESADYLEIKAQSYSDLLQFLFMCIVDVSEVPEFVFGTAVNASNASVSEQLPALMKKVIRKRSELNSNYKLLCRMVFSIYNDFSFDETKKFQDYKVKVQWEDVEKDDIFKKSQTITTLISGLVQAIDYKLISYESAINYLGQYIENMEAYQDEKKKIIEQFEEMTNDSMTEELKIQIEEIKEKITSNSND